MKTITEIILAVITLAFRMFVLNLSIKALLAASVLTSITSALISPAFISGPLVSVRLKCLETSEPKLYRERIFRDDFYIGIPVRRLVKDSCVIHEPLARGGLGCHRARKVKVIHGVKSSGWTASFLENISLVFPRSHHGG